ncbi:hypothetical protein D9611_010768 [Ephemerocybe angulata]|uniref:superoxide dismutase n=1 Tax=Ephemerocybe angulata TaxID=980116 RepID=A0A8H5BBW2_9AGAR|nr:hypothetical protein D9611_010768 [Tulosesus angulatus]
MRSSPTAPSGLPEASPKVDGGDEPSNVPAITSPISPSAAPLAQNLASFAVAGKGNGVTLEVSARPASAHLPHYHIAPIPPSNPAECKGNGGVLKNRPLNSTIEQVSGSPDALKKEFNTATLGIQGSGRGWLRYTTQTKCLEIATTPNQDPLLSLVPIIGVDIWEHAFYLQYLNAKSDLRISDFTSIVGVNVVVILVP